jgi:hypothetical protein
MQRRNANFRTEPGDSAWRPKAGERRARAGMRQLQIFPVGQRRLAPFLRISVHQIGAIWKEALMRVLIVGGGIAGLSLAAMLRLREIEPILIEEAFSGQDGGYVIGLWPMGTHVLYGLNRLLRRNGGHTPCAVLRHGLGNVSVISYCDIINRFRGATIS